MGTSAARSILIAGAGPTGLTLALELARRGIFPRIVDRDAGTMSLVESRALGINARTLALLEPSGVTPALLSEALALKEFRMRSGRHALLTIRIGELAGRFPALSALPQGFTERILLDRLRQLGIEPEWNTTILSTGGGPEAPELTLLRSDGDHETVRPHILIGADGAHSVVRKGFGFAFPGDTLETRFFLADYRYVQAVDTSFGEMNFINPGVLGRLPVRWDVLRHISTLEDFETRIVHPAEIAEQTWKSEFTISFRHVEELSRGRVFLAGDAAHIHSPAGARGMNLGIEDACWLAWLISEGRQAEYSHLRLPAVRTVLGDTRRNTTMITLKNPVAVALRNRLLPLAVRIPAVARAALRGVAGLDTAPPPWIANAA